MARYKRLRGAALGALLLLAAAPAVAAEDEANAPKVPRFVSLDAEKVNLRTGPGQRYPIDWVLTRRDMPVEVIAQFENWRRIPRSAGSAAPRSSPVAGSGTSLFPGVSLRMSSLTVGERSTTAPSQLSILPVGTLLIPPLIIPLRTEHDCS